MSRLKVHTEFTFGEIINNIIGADFFVAQSEDEVTLRIKFGEWYSSQVNLPKIFSNVFKVEENVILFNTHIYQLFQGLYNRYRDEAFVFVDTPFTPWDRQVPAWNSPEVENATKNQFRKLLAKMDDSYPRYAKLLELYSESESKLLGKLSSVVEASANVEGLSRFNDTPQEGGMYEDDTHTTNVTETSSDTTSGSTTTYDDKNIMQRLNEVRDMYKNVMEDWISQFSEFFWEVEGYEN